MIQTANNSSYHTLGQTETKKENTHPQSSNFTSELTQYFTHRGVNKDMVLS